MTDEVGSIKVTFVAYRCRVCGDLHAVEIGVAPREVHGELHLCPINHRLYHGECDTCETERTHVLDAPGVDAAHERNPIDALAHPDVLDADRGEAA